MAKEKKEKKKGKAKWIVLAVVVIVIIAAVAGGGDDDSTIYNTDPDTTQQGQQQEETKDNQEEKKPEEKDMYGVGEKATVNDVSVTLVGVEESTGAEFFTPDEGNVFVLCEFEIENNSNKDINVSSLISFESYIDDYSTTLDLTAESSSNKNKLDGTVAAGKKMNGIIGYQTKAAWSTIEIKFTPDFWSGKDMTFVYSK